MALTKQEMDLESVDCVPAREVMWGFSTGLVNVHNILNHSLNNSLDQNNILDDNKVFVVV